MPESLRHVSNGGGRRTKQRIGPGAEAGRVVMAQQEGGVSSSGGSRSAFVRRMSDGFIHFDAGALRMFTINTERGAVFSASLRT